MGALEDVELEKARARIGALVLLTQYSSPRRMSGFSENNIVWGLTDLVNEGYVEKKGEMYELNDKGWKYARKTLEDIGKIF